MRLEAWGDPDTVGPMAPLSIRILKEDSLGRVEWIEGQGSGEAWIRRVACGGKWPLSGWLARRLMARERRALLRLHGVPGLPNLVDGASSQAAELTALQTPGRPAVRERDLLIRSATQGAALHQATQLPCNCFDRLEQLVQSIHDRGICHNDLHKEQNVMVDVNGFPGLIDFQLGSVHAQDSRAFRTRCHEDLRHVQKHRRRYLRDGRGPGGVHSTQAIDSGAGAGLGRRPLSKVWRATGKPLYHFLTRKVLKRWDGEERRESSGPWPTWTEALGEWPGKELASGSQSKPQ
ncbi:MAG: phosphotransferase [Sulfitobacter sp.]|nr:phosphotransferase [Sulfitobacter sp.]